MNEKREGWKFVEGARKWHYFRSQRALCGKWACFGREGFEQGNDESPENCAECRRRRVKETTKA